MDFLSCDWLGQLSVAVLVLSLAVVLVSVAISAPKIYVPQDEETLKNPRRTLYVWNDRIKTKGNTKPFRLDGKHRGDKRCEVQKINVFCPSAMLDDEELSNYSGDFRVEALVCGQVRKI